MKKDIIIKDNSRIKAGNVLTPELMWKLKEINSIELSKDGKDLLFGVKKTSIKKNYTNRDIFFISIGDSKIKRLTKTSHIISNERWSNDGLFVYFISSLSKKKHKQIFRIKKTDFLEHISRAEQITDIDSDIESFELSPDNSKIMFVTRVKAPCKAKDLYPKLKKVNVRIIDDLMYKHWDEWIVDYPHPFVADLKDKKISNIVDLLKDTLYESPMRPFGGVEQICWSPDSKTIAYTCKKKNGLEYSLSTNSNIYLYNVENKKTENITENNFGFDTNPLYSPDGKYIAYMSQKRDGYESDQNRLFIYDIKNKKNIYVNPDFDDDVIRMAWASDSKNIFFTGALNIVIQIFKVNILNKQTTQITDGLYDVEDLIVNEKDIYILRHSMIRPNEIYSVNCENGEMSALTNVNGSKIAKLDLPEIEMRMIKTTDGKLMPTWVVYPPKFDKNKKYPSILFCTGGPQGHNGQFWSTRWNMHLMAAKGYVAVLPQRRGVLGFGTEWKEQISGDYAGQNMKDYLSAADEILAEPYVKSMGCVGASYGGYSVYWLAGNHNKRFKAFISHSGILNCEAQYLETEEMWFENWDMGGAFWNKSNEIAKKSFEAGSPHRYIQNWDTPIMCIHGEYDFRIVATQSMQAFNAAKLKGIPARLLIFPDETHFISKPQNSLLWHKEFYAWLDKYVV